MNRSLAPRLIASKPRQAARASWGLALQGRRNLRLVPLLGLLAAFATTGCAAKTDPVVRDSENLKQSLGDLVDEQGPVLDATERARQFPALSTAAPILYTGPSLSETPVMPLQAFAVTYDLDLVMTSDHPDWNMHEYARILTPAGETWIAKDARETAERPQTIVANLSNTLSFLPELEIERYKRPVTVRDRASERTDGKLDYSIRYVNPDGDEVEARYVGYGPDGKESPDNKRNTSTMGHSSQAVAVVLDMTAKRLSLSSESTITIDGTLRGYDTLGGVPVPIRAALKQTQAGLSSGSFTQQTAMLDLVSLGLTDPSQPMSALGVQTRHSQTNAETGQAYLVDQAWTVEERIVPEGEPEAGRTAVDLSTRDDFRTLRYRFIKHGDALELASIAIDQYAKGRAGEVYFNPRLPDASRPFNGTSQSRFVIDVNGQKSHGTGTISSSYSAKEGLRLDIRPTAPEWLADRPMVSNVKQVGDAFRTTVARVP